MNSAAWRYTEAWHNLMFGLRLGRPPLCAVATTPRPTKLIKDPASREGAGGVATRGTSYEDRIIWRRNSSTRSRRTTKAQGWTVRN